VTGKSARKVKHYRLMLLLLLALLASQAVSSLNDFYFP
jgi:hypothetical protein